MSDRVENLLEQMTLQEKVSLLAGADFWHTVPIERLGIPALKVSDGPNGARGDGFTGGTKAACFPAAIALAATWNTQLVGRIGQALGQETKTKGARVLLAPTVNIHRSPINGRNFECYSEDPYLSARMAVAYITGLQSQGVGATVKHYVCNDSEFERNSISSEVGERPLHEIYLPPFKAAVQEAGTWAVMSSYNKINGTFASENHVTLTEILREQWGFDGVTMSDWFGTKSTAPSVNAGLDLEMPGPAQWRGEKLLHAVEQGEVTEETIDEHVRRILRLLEKSGRFENPVEEQEQAIDLPEHRALIREAAGEGIVLLKNERQVLPLQRDTLRSVAIIGPNAKTAQIMAGGSAQVNAHYAISPFEGVTARLGEHTTVGYEPGCANYKLMPLINPDQLLAGKEGDEHGFAVEYFNTLDLAGAPVQSTLSANSEFMWLGTLPKQINPQQFSMRATARFTVFAAGTYTFGLGSAGFSRLFIDGQEVIDNWTHQVPGDLYFGMGSAQLTCTQDLETGREYTIVLEFSRNENTMLSAVRLGCLPPLAVDSAERVVALATASEVALVCVGLSGEWESEGFDRPVIDLPEEQVALIERVAAANKNTVVVLNTGSPIAMPWLDKVAAVVQAWFPGQECGNAIADVLFGATNPSGKLTQTFPMRLEDNPAYINYPGENGKVYYGEGLFVGYRYYEKKRVAPLFPFGFGLSYTTFEYENIRLSAREIGPEDTVEVSIDVINTGQRAGKEIIQVYVRDIESRLHRPDKELKAFSKVHLEPGERRTVTLALKRDALAYYDDLTREWVAEAGSFEVLVGASSQDIRATDVFTLTRTSRFSDAPQKETVAK